MANERATAQVYLDGKQAEAAIDGLKVKANQLKQAIIAAGQAGDNASMKKLQSELTGVNSAMSTLKKETFDVQKVLNNLNGSSLNDLEKAFRKVQMEMKRVERSDPRFNELKNQAKLLKSELNGVSNEFRQQQSFISRVGDGFNKYFGIITAGAASFAGLIIAGKKAVDTFNEFEAKVSELSALTGLAGDDLKWLSDQAKVLSTSTVEGGIKITKSATEIVDAYKLMGSAKPELLKNKEALNQVTTQALILAEAAKMETGPAVTSLANIMNQFSAPADQAGKFINALAAGAKEGAAEVPDLNDAIVKFGAAAGQANVSVEQSIGLVETLAEKGVKGEIAGTGLRRMLLKMQTGADDTNPAIVGLNTALENLAAKNLSATEMTKMFGEEGYTVAQLITSNVKRYEDLTTAVTGTNVATEQAAINTDNNAAKLAQAQNRATLMRIELGEKLAPVMTSFVSTGSLMLKVLSAMVDMFTKHGTEILLVAGAITAYTIAVKVQTAETKANAIWTKISTGAQTAWSAVTGVLTGRIKIATVAQTVWNAVMAMNPIGAIIAGVALLAAGIVFLVKSMNAQTAAQKAVNDVTEQAKRDIIEQKNKIEDLLAVAKNEKVSLEQRKAALAELNKISPEYFGNLSIEKSTTEQLTKAGEAYIANLEKQALVKAAQARIDALRAENGNKEVDIQTKKTKWWESEAGAARRANKAITENKDAIKALQGIVDNNKDKSITTTTTVNNTTTDTSDPTNPSGDDANKKARDKAFEYLELSQKKELNSIKQHQLKVNATEEEYSKILADQELKALEEKLAMQVKYGEDTSDTVASILDKKLKIQEDADKKTDDDRKKEQKKSLDDLDNQQKNELALIKKNALAEGLTEEQTNAQLITKEIEYLNRKLALQTQFGDNTAETTAAIAVKINELAENAAKGDEARLKQIADLKEKYLNKEVTDKEQLNIDLADLEKLYQDGSIASYEEYQRLKTSINKKAEKERFDKVLEYGQAVQTIMGGVSDFFGAMKDRELAKAGTDEKKKEAIEAKYAKKQQGIAAFQAGINGAVAIMQLWAQPSVLPEPAGSIYKGVMSAIIGATTIAQIAAIKSKKFYSGGFASPGGKYEPDGIFHKGEFINAQESVNNPTIRPVLNIIDFAQKNGTARSINLPAAMAEIGMLPKKNMYSGGFASESTASSGSATIINQSDSDTKAIMGAVYGLLSKLDKEGVKAKAEINTREIFKSEENYQQSIKNSQF